MNETPARLCQIALSVNDLSRTIHFYASVFGLDDAGYVRSFRGPDAERVQGIEGIASTAHWLQDGRREFQLEFFQFEYPSAHAKPEGQRPCDIGMTRVAFDVRNLDETLERGRALGADAMTEPVTINGRRHAVVKDPDGILLEAIEAPEKLPAGRRAEVAGVAMSVSDLNQSLRLYSQAFGVSPHSKAPAARDALWGLAEAERDAVLLDGGCVWIELSEYHFPKSKPWRDGHLLTDIGISHIAFGAHSSEAFEALFRRATGAGLRPNNPEPVRKGKVAAVMYCTDTQGFTIEILYLHRRFHGLYGYTSPGPLNRLVQRLMDRWALKRYPPHEATPASRREPLTR